MKQLTSLLIVALILVFWSMGDNVTVSSQEPPQPPPQDGVAKCHNFEKDGEPANCPCWGYANPNEPQPPDCKPPEGEDPKCTNHCRKDLCGCKSKCQS